MDYEIKNTKRKLSPLVGESVNRQVDERGKCEKKRKSDGGSGLHLADGVFRVRKKLKFIFLLHIFGKGRII